MAITGALAASCPERHSGQAAEKNRCARWRYMAAGAEDGNDCTAAATIAGTDPAIRATAMGVAASHATRRGATGRRRIFPQRTRRRLLAIPDRASIVRR